MMNQLKNILIFSIVIIIAIIILKYIRVCERFEETSPTMPDFKELLNGNNGDININSVMTDMSGNYIYSESSTFIEGPNKNPIRRYIKNTSINNLNPVIVNLDIGNNKYLNVFMSKGFGNYKPLGQYVIISYKKLDISDDIYEKYLKENVSLNLLRYKQDNTKYNKLWDSKNMSNYVGPNFCIWRPISNMIYLGDVIWMGSNPPPSNIISGVPESEVDNIDKKTNYWNYEGINLNSNITNSNKVSRYNIKNNFLKNIEERNIDKVLFLNLSLI